MSGEFDIRMIYSLGPGMIYHDIIRKLDSAGANYYLSWPDFELYNVKHIIIIHPASIDDKILIEFIFPNKLSKDEVEEFDKYMKINL